MDATKKMSSYRFVCPRIKRIVTDDYARDNPILKFIGSATVKLAVNGIQADMISLIFSRHLYFWLRALAALAYPIFSAMASHDNWLK